MQNYQAPTNLLRDHIIAVTGAGDGIGRAAAKTYAAHGATVILIGKTIQKLEQVYDAIAAAGHPQAVILPIDFATATPDDYDRVREMLSDEFDQLDGLLHNASILGQRTPIANYSPGIWQQVMQVNINAPFMLTQALLPLMQVAADASIIFTSSGVGRKGRAYWGAYGVSKFATEGLMETLADELEGVSNIRINSLNPGRIRTAMRATAYPAEDPQTLCTPEEIMPLYLYLMGADSKGVSGRRFECQS
jgi:NAD(P)-dependent dehydrogenase (short-subunit alcohol dehydrogenase family)